MELLREAVKIEKLIGTLEEQALVEGEVSLPSSKNDIESVLFVEARVGMDSAEGLEGRVMMEGTVVFNVIYRSTDGEITSFESSSNFKHNIDFGPADTGVDCEVAAQVQQVEYTVADRRRLNASAVVNLACTVTQQQEVSIVSGVDENSDLQQINDTIYIPTLLRGSDRLQISEDAMLNQGLPGVEEILGVSGYGRIKSARAELDRLVVEGEAKIWLVYHGGEEEPLVATTLSVPFSGIMEMEGLEESANVFASVRLSEIFVAPIDEGSRMLSVDFVANLNAVAVQLAEYPVIQDCYSLSSEVTLEKETLSCRQIKGHGYGKCVVKENMVLPGGMPPIDKVAMANASAMITSKQALYGKVAVEGILFIGVVYLTQEQDLRSLNVQTAFSGEIDVSDVTENMEIEITADIESIYVNGLGNEFEVKVILDAEVTGFINSEMDAVTDITFTPKEKSLSGGITIYFASEGETPWSVAKKFNTKVDIICKYNPEIQDADALKEGQKLYLYRPYAC